LLARDLVQPGSPALNEIIASFGPEIVTEGGALNRSGLAQVVFSDPRKRKILEDILHPRIRNAWQSAFARRETESAGRSVVVIPLLFETGAERELDLVICIACSLKSQQERLRARGWSDEEIRRRSAAQRPTREKMDLSHRVVWTEYSPAITESQVIRIFKTL
jgi:dephospho-CoA kinase